MPSTTHSGDPNDPQITLRLKHGIHTVFLFAMPEWTFSHLSAELLDILRERYPDGLTTSRPPNPEKTTPIPADDSEVTIVYGVPKSMDDLSMGWKDLKAKGGDTLADKKLGEQSVVAFALVDADDEDGGRVEFEVELPTFEDDQGEEEL